MGSGWQFFYKSLEEESLSTRPHSLNFLHREMCEHIDNDGFAAYG